MFLHNAIKQKVINDPTMQAFWATASVPNVVKFYYEFAKRDIPGPYLVGMEHSNTDYLWPFEQGIYLLDIWDFGDSALRAKQIALQAKILLTRFSFSNDTITNGRLWPLTEHTLNTRDERYTHISMSFYFRFYNVGLANGVLAEYP